MLQQNFGLDTKAGPLPSEFVGPQQNAVRDIVHANKVRLPAEALADFTYGRFDAADPSMLVHDLHFREQIDQTDGIAERFNAVLANPRACRVVLSAIENNGHWNRHRIESDEAAIRTIATAPTWGQQSSGYLESDSPKSKRRMWLAPGLVEEQGKIALRRKRNLFTSGPRQVALTDYKTGHTVERWQQLEITKISDFSFNIEVASQHLGKIRQSLVQSRDDGAIVEPEDLLLLVEDAIKARADDILSPATTIYEATQKYFTAEDMHRRGLLAKSAVLLS